MSDKKVPQTQAEKNSVLINQTSQCLANAARYARAKDFQRKETAIQGALTDLKAVKDFSDAEALSAFRQKVRKMDDEVRANRAKPELFEAELEVLSREALTLLVVIPDYTELLDAVKG